MTDVSKIGTQPDGRVLYEVTTHNNKSGWDRKTTYSVAPQDADKFEKFHQAQDELIEDLKKYENTPELNRKAKLKMGIGMGLGTIIGAGIPLLSMILVKNKVLKVICAIATVIGGALGFLYGTGISAVYKVLPKELQQKFNANLAEYRNIDVLNLKEERYKADTQNTDTQQ